MNIIHLSSYKALRQLLKPSVIVVGMVVGSISIFWPEPLNAEDVEVRVFSLSEQYRQFSRADLREIFFGRQTQWPDGTSLRVFVLPDKHPVHIRFSKEILGIYPYQLRSAWDRMVFSGTGTPPVAVDSLEEMQMQLKKTPGAIGYVEE